jgi:hypothetical protein
MRCHGFAENMYTCEVIDHGSIKHSIVINGYPFWSHEQTNDQVSCNGTINHLLKRGENILAVRVLQKAKTSNTEDDWFVVRIIQTAGNSVSNNPPAETNLVEITDGNETNMSFRVSELPVERLPWDGPSPVLLQADKDAIRHIVQQLYSAFCAKDTKVLKTLFKARNEHYAKATKIGLEQTETMQDDFFQKLFGNKNFSLESCDLATLAFTVQPDANLVRIKRNGADPIVAKIGEGAKFRLPIYVSKKGTEWIIVQ